MSYSVDRLHAIAKIFGVYKEWPVCSNIIEIFPENPLHSINSAINLGINRLTIILDIIDDSTRDLVALADATGIVTIKSFDDFPSDMKYDIVVLNDYDFLMAKYSKQHVSIMTSQDYFNAMSSNGLNKFSDIVAAVKDEGIIVVKHQVARPDTHAPQFIDMLRYHVKDVVGLEEKVSATRSFINTICDQDHQNYSDYRQAKNISNIIENMSSRDILMKFITDDHERLPFYKFSNIAKTLGLKFISDYNLKTMLVGDIPIKIRDLISSSENVIKNEQYLDFIRRRYVRRSIFIKTTDTAQINYEVICDIINDFNIRFDVTAIKSLADYANDDEESFSFGGDQHINTNHQLHKIILKTLSEAHPRYLNMETLINSCLDYMALSSYETPDKQDILNFVLCLFFDTSPDNIEFCDDPSIKKVATNLSASYSLSIVNLELLKTESEVIDRAGNFIKLDDFEREILYRLNSSMKVNEIISGSDKDDKSRIIKFIMKMLKSGIFLKV